ncbi:pyridoxamine 5'-phosphate oxidase family protein [Glaciihabitans sp. GrIS 2.15]|uniref:pyridoxamine 5'-phosphate oxidase family protein n=1 Tax=Glaciihabitans sp. GrIS 2.15 TaxID=3071710 RepID=UPI001989C017|nr:pyridoxamine 5'-phosphate oxidase family protein [Microbacteriaceae bacterium]MEC5168891.1 nitroimidazol reductase NimA-like FMN-containing flavoprotein (pyridoxamine 5'-phosphate oxidase superfamily) [Glaciihabitans sp. GrIS 2.15]
MPTSAESALEVLGEEQSWHLLASADLARLAVSIDGGVDIFPINYVVADRVIFFRTAPGSKLMDLTKHPIVALETDGTHNRRRWSVVVKGSAVRLGSDEEIEASGVLSLHSLVPTEKWNYVRITVSSITGRQFTSSRQA